jgi:hypothetical protein
MSATFTGGLTVKYGDGASPEVFALIEEVIALGGLGANNPLIDVTSHDSTAREFIAGLADGQELSVECNRVHTAANIQDDVIDEVIAKTNFNMEITVTDGTVAVVYTFAVTPISWLVNTSFDDKTTLSLALKITGAIGIA